MRCRIRDEVRRYAEASDLIPPLSAEELLFHAGHILGRMDLQSRYLHFTAVLMGNALWKDRLAAVPFHRRVLLLPQCLRNRETCPAQTDALGLVCEQCGSCQTGSLQAEAEALGYVTLIAEGTTVVTRLLETGKIDAVIGIGCLDSLVKSFPYASAGAIPGIAIPLNSNGCDRTTVDADRAREAIHLFSKRKIEKHADLDRMRSDVIHWFEMESLSELLELDNTANERIACEWMAAGGKRWRPFLAACIHQTLKGPETVMSETIKYLAVAVECFHKASLIHDDIEDNDTVRYGKPTLHLQQGIPVALNIGDLLIGEGYRLIAECGATASQKERMLSVAAKGHRDLCLGQGEELGWTRNPGPLPTTRVLDIFRRKTSPAFEVALNLGAICGGADQDCQGMIRDFSDALGIAYQIRDDIEDGLGGTRAADFFTLRPSLLVSLALEKADAPSRIKIDGLMKTGSRSEAGQILMDIVRENAILDEAWDRFERYKKEALHALSPLQNHELKCLLYRIVYKILGIAGTGRTGKHPAMRESLQSIPAE